MTLKHSLYSQNLCMPIAFFEVFNREDIKAAIMDHLRQYPNDTLEHCREFSKEDVKKYYGNEIINFYKVNKRSGNVCRIVMKGNKEFLQNIEQ